MVHQKAKYEKWQQIREISQQMLLSLISPPKWRMTGESVRKLAQAYEVSARTVHAALMRTSALKEVGQVGDQTIFIGDEEGAIQDTQGGRGSLRVLNNILTV
jgi:hypothetical protein